MATANVTLGSPPPPLKLPEAGARWMRHSLTKIDVKDFSELDEAQKKDFIDQMKSAATMEKAKAIFTAIVASIILIVALPIIAGIAFIGGSGLIIATPNMAFYPLVAALLGGGGVAGAQVCKGICQFYSEHVIDRLALSRDLRQTAHQIGCK